MRYLPFAATVLVAAGLTMALFIEHDATIAFIGWASLVVGVLALIASAVVDVSSADPRALVSHAVIDVALVGLLALPLLRIDLPLGIVALGLLAAGSIVLALRSLQARRRPT